MITECMKVIRKFRHMFTIHHPGMDMHCLEETSNTCKQHIMLGGSNRISNCENKTKENMGEDQDPRKDQGPRIKVQLLENLVSSNILANN
jgi:hypothetical protein